jgi:hypothetical protein
MSFKTDPGIGFTHAAAIINYLYQRFSGVIDDQADLGSPCIHGIFEQFLNGACGPLDNFPGGYLVGNMIR